MARKLGVTSDQRRALLRNQVSDLLWYGRIETTVERAKEVSRTAEKMITVAIKGHEDTVRVSKMKENLKGEKVEAEFINDGTKKLACRRKMMTFLRDIKETKGDKESKSAYANRTREIKHPLIEKMFNEYAPKYAARIRETNNGGGYTRIIKLGSRRGDNAEMAIIEMV